jgi:hypothetical protein
VWGVRGPYSDLARPSKARLGAPEEGTVRDPTYRYTALAIVAIALVGVAAAVLAGRVTPSLLLALLVSVGLPVSAAVSVAIMRSKPIVAPAGSRPALDSSAVRFEERVSSVLAHELFGVNQAIRVVVADSELVVAWDGRLTRKFAAVDASSFGALATGRGFRVALSDITVARRRRMNVLQALWELLRPYQGLGMLGEWKFRVRGVTTGVSLRTRGGLRAWVATRRPAELLAAIRPVAE